jgi:biotin carboxylase
VTGRILFIEAVQYGTYYADRYAHICKLGYDVHVLYGTGTLEGRDRAHHRVAGERNIDTLIAAAAGWHRETHFDGITTLCEPSVLATAEIATVLGLSYPSLGAALLSRDKFEMRCAHRGLGVPHPHFIGLREIADLAAWPESAYPAIVKPAMGSASSFVFRADTPEELRRYAQLVLENVSTMAVAKLEAEMPLRDAPSVVVERFLDGSEHLVEGYVYNGCFVLGSLVDRITLEGVTFDDDVHHAPSRLSLEDQHRVGEVIGLACAAQKIDMVTVHAEVRFHEARPYIVEIGIRPGGGGLNLMAGESFGYDPLDMVARLALGQMPGPRPAGPTGVHTAAACLMGDEGQISVIEGAEALRDDPSVFFFKLVAAVGTELRRPPRGNSIVGFLGVRGISYADVVEKLNRKSAKLRVIVEEVDHVAG